MKLDEQWRTVIWWNGSVACAVIWRNGNGDLEKSSYSCTLSHCHSVTLLHCALHTVTVHSASSGNHVFSNDRGADSRGYTQWEQSWEINNKKSALCFFCSGELADIGHILKPYQNNSWCRCWYIFSISDLRKCPSFVWKLWFLRAMALKCGRWWSPIVLNEQ